MKSQTLGISERGPRGHREGAEVLDLRASDVCC